MCDTSYETAQICENGHIITIRYNSEPYSRKDFCPECGAKTFTKCPHCHKPLQGSLVQKELVITQIRGYFDDYQKDNDVYEDVYYDDKFKFPNYCYNCGEPFPWTKTLFKETSEIVDLMNELSDEQKEDLKKYIRSIVLNRDNPKLSAIKLSEALKFVSKELVQALASTLSGKIVSSLATFLGW